MGSSTKAFRFIGAGSVQLADGQVLEPGEPYDLTSEQLDDPYTKELLDREHLAEISTPKKGAKDE